MVFLSSFPAGLSATKAGFELIKGVRELLKRQQVDPGEISARLLELQELMLQAQEALGTGQEENRQLRQKLEELQRVSAIGEEFTFAEGVYWHRDYPYCPNCWDADRRPIRLDGPYGITHTEWRCPEHKSQYYLQKHKRPPNI